MTSSDYHTTQITSPLVTMDSYRLIQSIYLPLSKDYERTYHRETNLNSTESVNMEKKNPDRIIMLSSLAELKNQSLNLGQWVLSISEKRLHLQVLDTALNTCIRQREFQCIKEMIALLSSPVCLKASVKAIFHLKWLPITNRVRPTVSLISKDRKKHLCHAITRTKSILNMKKCRFNLTISRLNYY